MDDFEGWLTTDEAARLTGYKVAYVRLLAVKGRVAARKVGRLWLLDRAALLEWAAEMQALGVGRHNPWRPELAAEGRGRAG